MTVKAVYNKLKGIEPTVMREMVRQTAARMQAIIKQSGGEKLAQVPGYRLKIVDGNHLQRTDRRIGELRELNIAPLPGKSLAMQEPQVELVTDVFPCEDGHAQERSLIPQMLETVIADDLWLADRNFCTIACLLGIASRKACFVIRQHAGMPFERQSSPGTRIMATIAKTGFRVLRVHGFVRRLLLVIEVHQASLFKQCWAGNVSPDVGICVDLP